MALIAGPANDSQSYVFGYSATTLERFGVGTFAGVVRAATMFDGEGVTLTNLGAVGNGATTTYLGGVDDALVPAAIVPAGDRLFVQFDHVLHYVEPHERTSGRLSTVGSVAATAHHVFWTQNECRDGEEPARMMRQKY